MPATYKNRIDFDGDGTFAAVYDDVTARSLDERTPLTIRYGRDQARQFSPISPGEARYELDNNSRDYSPENTSSTLSGKVLPNRQVQVQATLSGVTTTLFAGYLNDFQLKPDPDEKSIDVTCTDALGRLKGVTVSTQIYQGVRTGDAIGYLLDAAGWSASLRDLDSGASFLPFWWADAEDAFEALLKLVDSEGPSALVTVDSSGRIVFRDRHHRLTRSASLTVQSTWRSSIVEPCISAPVTYDHGWAEIVNTATVPAAVRTIASQPTVIWSQPGLLNIADGETIQITAGGSPFVSAITPVAGTDYTLVAGAVSIVLSQTSGASTTLSLTATGATTISDLQLRAYAIQSVEVNVSVSEPVSIGKYGPRSLPADRLPVWCNVYDVEAILELHIGKRSERLPTVSVTMRGAGNSTRLNQCLTRNLSDRVHITETHTGLDSDCYLEQIQHTIGQGGYEHVTVFGAEKIPATVSNVFQFNTAGHGFDQGLFGMVGQDIAATMFRFDTGGQGFDQGLFST